MRDGQARAIHLQDYRAPDFRVERVALDVDLYEDHAIVRATLAMQRSGAADAPCRLDGVGLTLEQLQLDGADWPSTHYHYDGEVLTLEGVPDRFVLATVVRLAPQLNTELEGLYRSNGMFCTQCEAEGFRRITFYPDRPDVLSRFVTTVRADAVRYPVLLSNGNPIAQGEEGGRHWVTWEDPFPKPSYLFALVAGDLSCQEDRYVTGSGREVALRLYAEPQDLDKLDHAMASLKASMLWDEQAYGREYDLDIYMIVAVSHFNMGAMENKGLNIFNTSCVLAHPKTTTDAGFQRVESVIAHEYFHNWSGNRVTCRDWFQLSLKEGFTVFRDQCFSADMNSAAVKRIEDVDMLRAHQFPEDQGPMAHPVRPQSYQKIDNFYTLTIYEKGAEIVRMLHTLLGADDFRRGSDLYFERFDGQAVTTDDFVACMAEVSGRDLAQFKRWYSQAGTPQVTVSGELEGGRYRLSVHQQTPPTPGQPDKQPLLIPLRLALLDGAGHHLPLNAQGDTELLLELTEPQQQWEFALPPGVERVVPSLLRGFSAPVMLAGEDSEAALRHLLTHDDDGFCRWDAAQRLYRAAILRLVDATGRAAEEAAQLAPAMKAVLAGAGEDAAAAALLLALPSATQLADSLPEFDIAAVQQAHDALAAALGHALATDWWQVLERWAPVGEYQPVAADIGARALYQQAASYLAATAQPEIGDVMVRRFAEADNMTDQLGALRLLVHERLQGADAALADFARQWQHEPLVMDQWFGVQASAPWQTAAGIEALLEDARFDWATPNRVRSVLGQFSNANAVAFHRADGSGYRLFASALQRLDQLNPQMAARLAGACGRLGRLPAVQQHALREALQQLVRQPLSGNLDEVLTRILA
ncbi:aminopeptidase N [Isoalcanivorax beigongshangi]|uniref:Aminopeptidase N n=1 Tax=Isoalcanivorax beigongshangi TaxID=3238810 RepID=A0ABV4AIT1_9GAMM